MVQPEVKSGDEAFEQCCKGQMRWNLWLFLIKRSVLEQPSPLPSGEEYGGRHDAHGQAPTASTNDLDGSLPPLYLCP